MLNFYKVGPAGDRHFDDVGLSALEADWAAWSGEPSNDLIKRSQFSLFYEIGIHLFGRNSGQAREYALYFFEKGPPVTPILQSPDPQRALPFDSRPRGNNETVPARLFGYTFLGDAKRCSIDVFSAGITRSNPYEQFSRQAGRRNLTIHFRLLLIALISMT